MIGYQYTKEASRLNFPRSNEYTFGSETLTAGTVWHCHVYYEFQPSTAAQDFTSCVLSIQPGTVWGLHTVHNSLGIRAWQRAATGTVLGMHKEIISGIYVVPASPNNKICWGAWIYWPEGVWDCYRAHLTLTRIA